MSNKSCINCAFYKNIKVNQCMSSSLKAAGDHNWSNGDGFACAAFSDEDVIIQMIGYDESESYCESYSPRLEVSDGQS